ncbi:MAG: tetratricopeptide repeat protein [Endomicrobiaceae bacterium]|nr:tetratricopeptide repeat protein [Endomicrobiaceae bacterium]
MEKIKNFLETNLAFLIILTVIVFAIYGKSINYEFTKYDDNTLITRNINFLSEFKNIPQLFTTSCYYSSNYTYYRPILTLSFAIESIIFGNNTKVYHLSNIILFILSIYLMYIFLTQLRQNSTILKFICLLIAVHPMFSSTVAWIPARNDTLLIIFICLSFINLINYLNYRKNTNILLFFLFYSLSLFTKETALILIPMYVFFIYIFKIKITKKQIIKIGMGLLPIIACYFYLRNVSTSNPHINLFAWQQHSSIILKGTMIYIYKFLIPGYIPVMLYNINININILIVNIVLLLFLLLNLSKKFTNNRIMIFGFVWLIFWLLPTFLMNDYVLLFQRFLLPSIGISLILCEFTNNILLKYPVSKKYFIIIFIILFGLYFFASFIQADKYKNPFVFWANAYSDAKTYHVACHGFSQRYLEIRDYDKSKKYLLLAEHYSPNRYLLDIAAVLLYENKFEDAEKLLFKSAELNPATKDLVYGNLSKLYIERNDIKKALRYAQMGYNLNKNDIEFAKLLITAYKLNNEFENALNICFDLLKHDRKNAQYYYTIGTLYESLKDYKNAVKYIDEGLKLAPENITLIEKLKSLKEQNNENN